MAKKLKLDEAGGFVVKIASISPKPMSSLHSNFSVQIIEMLGTMDCFWFMRERGSLDELAAAIKRFPQHFSLGLLL
jgi:hypothetical protein